MKNFFTRKSARILSALVLTVSTRAYSRQSLDTTKDLLGTPIKKTNTSASKNASDLVQVGQTKKPKPPAKDRDVHEFKKDLIQAMRANDKKKLRLLVEEYLSRDITPHFITYLEEMDDDPTELVIRALRDNLGELGERVKAWEQQLAKQPNSQRLNFLLAVAESDVKKVNSEATGTSQHLPVRLQITRKGSEITAKPEEKGWSLFKAQSIPMPRKVLIGIAANGVTAHLSKPVFIKNGVEIKNVKWIQKQISRPQTKGKMKVSNNQVEITGAGWRLDTSPVDNVFFAYTELEGDGSLEVFVNDWGKSQGGSVGIMLRSSLDPGAPYVAVVAEQNNHIVNQWVRREQSHLGKYLSALSEVRPQNTDFLLHLIRKMLRSNLPTLAQRTANQLLQANPSILTYHMDLFKEVFERNDKQTEFTALVATRAAKPQNESQKIDAAFLLNKQANDVQRNGDHKAALALWKKARELTPGGRMLLMDYRQYLLSLMKTEQLEELRQELKTFFLNPSTSEEILSRVQLSNPALSPMVMPFFRMAAEYKVAGEIAAQLEKTRGSPHEIAATKLISLALKSAADPTAVNPKQLSLESLPDQGLALLAFVLQQSAEGRSTASFLVEELSERASASSSESAAVSRRASTLRGERYDKGELLLWELRLADLRGDRTAQARISTAMSKYIRGGALKDQLLLHTAIQRLLRSGDISMASQVLKQAGPEFQRKKPDPANPFSFDSNDPVAESIYLRDLHEGKDPVVPVIWTESAGDEIIVHWELAPDSTRSTLQDFDARALGVRVPRLDGRFDLELYGTYGLHTEGDFPKDDKVARIPIAASKGSWKGKRPAKNSWIIATLKEGNKQKSFSRSAPVRSGENLLEPLNIQSALNKSGKWRSFSKWFWGGELKGEFPLNALFISRLQPDFESIAIEHEAIPIRSDEVYNFTGWIRTDTWHFPSIFQADAKFQVHFFDQAGNRVTEWVMGPRMPGRWIYLSQQFGPGSTGGNTAIPPSAVSAKVRIILRSQGEVGDLGFYRAR